MDWNERLEKIIEYIELHLQKDEDGIDHLKIQSLAGCSFSLFQRVFLYMNGLTLAEYIRNRKMTLAGYDFKSSDIRVLDASVKYGYDSPTSFTRAFQAFHGVTPKIARREDVALNVYPKMNFTKDNEVRWFLENKKSFRILGKNRSISLKDGAAFREIPAFWNELLQKGDVAEIAGQKNEDAPDGILGMFHLNMNSEKMTYSIASVSDKPETGDMKSYVLPEALWAIFQCRGAMPKGIQKGWKFLNEEWMVKYPFKHADCPEIEWYPPGNSFDEDYISEIWIPVIEED